MIKSCVVCGTEFDAKAGYKCCSNACSKLRRKETNRRSKTKQKYKDNQKAYNQRPEIKARRNEQARAKAPEYNKLCENCGGEFTAKGRGAKRKVYCSRNCKEVAYRRKKYPVRVAACCICGIEFETAKSKVMTCGKDCSNALLRLNKKKCKQKKRASKPLKNCVVCGVAFEYNTTTNVCSDTCREIRTIECKKQTKHKIRANERRKERLRSDPEFRERLNSRRSERHRERYHNDIEYKERVTGLLRERYHNDIEYRERVKSNNRKSRARRKIIALSTITQKNTTKVEETANASN